jgi:hypothetical protein
MIEFTVEEITPMVGCVCWSIKASTVRGAKIKATRYAKKTSDINILWNDVCVAFKKNGKWVGGRNIEVTNNNYVKKHLA